MSGLPQFQWNDVTDLVQIGQGSYGVVKFGRYKPSGGQTSKTRDVVFKLPRDINGNEKEFAKEAKLLNGLKGHSNIVSFEQEKRLTSTSSPRFWSYLSRNEKMMRRSMIESARMKAGMPSDKAGNVLRCYTNQSEAVNNKLTRQKEAITGKAKNKSDLKKIEFVRDVWEEVDNQQQSELKLAMFGMSEEYELSDEASYLEVNPEDWFEWPEEKRSGICPQVQRA